ncbi:hypothetical protein [Clostridium perfringens]|uniref:hypothetical protein n=1 Tax=Clostridium perfringens TaxID=1502 RepID=UPI0039EBAFF2
MSEETILNQPEATNANPAEVDAVNPVKPVLDSPEISTEEAPKEVPKMDIAVSAPENTVATNVVNTESSVPAEPTEHKEPTVTPALSDTPVENETEKAETVQPLEPTEPATSQPVTQPNIIQPETEKPVVEENKANTEATNPVESVDDGKTVELEPKPVEPKPVEHEEVKENTTSTTGESETAPEAPAETNPVQKAPVKEEKPEENKPAESVEHIEHEEKPKEEEHHWAGLVEDWRYRYKNRWATDYHIQMLLALHIITEREAEYIRTGK